MIGRLNETALHEQLKYHYAGEIGVVEQTVGGFIIDVQLPGELVEIQTQGFARLRRKIASLRASHRIRIVYPVAREKQIIKLKPSGELMSSRKSPRSGRMEEVYREIATIADLLPHRNLTIEVVLVRVVEIRSDDGKGSWRRRGVSVVERKLDSIESTVTLRTRRQFLSILPKGLPAQFTNSDLGTALSAPYRLVQPITNALRKMGLIAVAGVRGRENLFQVTESGR